MTRSSGPRRRPPWASSSTTPGSWSAGSRTRCRWPGWSALLVLAVLLAALWWWAWSTLRRLNDVRQRAARLAAARPRVALTGAGLALAATVLLAPVFHPWYATWPLAVLVGGRGPGGADGLVRAAQRGGLVPGPAGRHQPGPVHQGARVRSLMTALVVAVAVVGGPGGAGPTRPLNRRGETAGPAPLTRSRPGRCWWSSDPTTAQQSKYMANSCGVGRRRTGSISLARFQSTQVEIRSGVNTPPSSR